MKDYAERLRDIIGIIRQRDDWKANHEVATFGDKRIGYYDTAKNGTYFSLKHDSVAVTCHCSGGFAIEFGSWDVWNSFDMDKWITQLEKIVKQKTIVLDGKSYVLTEIKGR